MKAKSTHFITLQRQFKSLCQYISLTTYSSVPLMWTPKGGRAKSVHISKLPTVVDTLSCGHLHSEKQITEPHTWK